MRLSLAVFVAFAALAQAEDAAVLRPAQVGKKWGFVDAQGAIAIEARYREVGEFSSGLAAVCDGGKWGYIDAKGAVVVQPEYSDASPFANDTALVERKQGQLRATRLIDREGKTLAEVEVNKDREARAGGEGLLLVREKLAEKWKRYFLGRDAKRIEGEWANAEPFSEGLAAATFMRPESLSSKKDQMSYVGADGKVVIEGTWSRADPFSEGLAYTEWLGTNRWVIDRQGKQVFELVPPLIDVRRFSQGRAAVHDQEMRWGFLDATGKLVIPIQFEEVGDFHDGRARFTAGENQGFIDLDGRVAIEPAKRRYDDFLGGLARWKLPDRSWGYVDTTGKEVWTYHRD